ncbi:MAG: NUDIX hydrolase [Acidobacteria bacterium]|nr:NUDIX hydrolase [Acidobacteriota bacterium]|tara:strand:+ start:1423 stop:1857 length:435 start_codon:yes stop_codon:yes gene_type:complete
MELIGSRSVEQAAAIPFRHRKDKIEICLITTVNSGRWTIPKGFIDPGDTASATAIREAQEEAGIHGRVFDNPVGYYDIVKQSRKLTVAAFLLEVDSVDHQWDEQHIRQRRWTTARRAAKLLDGRPVSSVFRRALNCLNITKETS